MYKMIFESQGFSILGFKMKISKCCITLIIDLSSINFSVHAGMNLGVSIQLMMTVFIP